MQESWDIRWEDYYKILQIHPSAKPEIVKVAYRRLSQEYHPDKNKDPASEERMKKLNTARDVLSDPEKRKRYDSVWVKKAGMTGRSNLPKPKPTVDPPHIRFSNVEPGKIKRASFIIRNVGGPYSGMITNPTSWVEIVGYFSLSDEELPLKVEIEAKGEDWGKSYSEHITVKLDEQETQVRVELQTKPEPVKEKAGVSSIPKSKPTAPPLPPRPATPRRGFPTWGKWVMAVACMAALIIGRIAILGQEEVADVYNFQINRENGNIIMTFYLVDTEGRPMPEVDAKVAPFLFDGRESSLSQMIYLHKDHYNRLLHTGRLRGEDTSFITYLHFFVRGFQIIHARYFHRDLFSRQPPKEYRIGWVSDRDLRRMLIEMLRETKEDTKNIEEVSMFMKPMLADAQIGIIVLTNNGETVLTAKYPLAMFYCEEEGIGIEEVVTEYVREKLRQWLLRERQSDYMVVHGHIRDIAFVENHIWIVIERGVASQVFYSPDGGNTWVIQWRAGILDRPFEVEFLNEKEGWLATNHAILHTTDGGNTWSYIWRGNCASLLIEFEVIGRNHLQGQLSDGHILYIRKWYAP